MDNASARCKDDDRAFQLAFSPSMADASRMIMDYCNDCAIRAKCLVFAIEIDAYGIWGGTTRMTRKDIKTMI